MMKYSSKPGDLHDDCTQNYIYRRGSTIFVKNILGDVFHREALKRRILP